MAFLDAYITIRQYFHVKLPSPGRLGPEFVPVDMPLLCHADTGFGEVSSFTACLLMVDLAVKCLDHNVDLRQHYASLTKCFANRMVAMRNLFTRETLQKDPIALTTYLNMRAIEIILDEMAVRNPEEAELSRDEVHQKILTRKNIAENIYHVIKECWSTRTIEVGPC